MRINHLNIVVADMEKSLAFYVGKLGLKQVFDVELTGSWIESVTALPNVHAKCVFLQPEEGGTRIELLEYVNPSGQIAPTTSLANTQGLRHLAFELNDLDAMYEKLVAQGVPFLSEPIEVPFAVVGNIKKRLCYCIDPDGVIVELADYKVG